MKEIKTDQRSSLGASSLDSLMVLKAEAAAIISFNPVPAIELWLLRAERRPGQDEDVLESDSDL